MGEHQNRDVVTYNSNINDAADPASKYPPGYRLESNINDTADPASKYPPGYRFFPTDEELVGYYLRKKVANEELPVNMRNDVELYKYNPEDLAENFKPQGDIHWYFFTPRDRKYPNGARPNRAAADGFWKATGADKEVRSANGRIGSKKALVFYKGKPPMGKKTDWIMHEYRWDDSPQRKRSGGNDMRLDDWVLCKIYKKANRKSKSEEVENEYNAEKKPGKETLIPSEPIQNHNDHGSDYLVHHFQSNHLLMDQPFTYNFHQYNQLGFAIDNIKEDPSYCNGYQLDYPFGPSSYSDHFLDDAVLRIDGDPAFEQWEQKMQPHTENVKY